MKFKVQGQRHGTGKVWNIAKFHTPGMARLFMEAIRETGTLGSSWMFWMIDTTANNGSANKGE